MRERRARNSHLSSCLAVRRGGPLLLSIVSDFAGCASMYRFDNKTLNDLFLTAWTVAE